MVTVIIPSTDEPKVVQYTKELIGREGFPAGSKVLVESSWEAGFKKVKTDFVCFLEPDCLVSSGYFMSLTGLLAGRSKMNKVAMMTSGTCVKYWPIKHYGYSFDGRAAEPVMKASSTEPYNVRVGYVPGAIIRMSTLESVKGNLSFNTEDIVKLSVKLSLAFWKNGGGCQVMVNPNTSYVTNDDIAGVTNYIDEPLGKLTKLFKQRSI